MVSLIMMVLCVFHARCAEEFLRDNLSLLPDEVKIEVILKYVDITNIYEIMSILNAFSQANTYWRDFLSSSKCVNHIIELLSQKRSRGRISTALDLMTDGARKWLNHQFSINKQIVSLLQNSLFSAASRGLCKRVAFILSLDKQIVDQLQRDGLSNTPLHKAVSSGCVLTVACLLNYGCDVNAVNDHRMTPLLIAARDNNYAVVKLLLEAGAKVNCKNARSYTPLMYAAHHANTEIVRLLLQYGALVAIRNFNDATAFDLARPHPQVHQLLIDHINTNQDEQCGFL